jgi:hypothetical protein
MKTRYIGLFILGGVVFGGTACGGGGALHAGPRIPIVRACGVTGDCTGLNLACAECMICHEDLDECTYGLQQGPHCPCVETERRNCDGGQQTCEEIPTNPGHTQWGPCLDV